MFFKPWSRVHWHPLTFWLLVLFLSTCLPLVGSSMFLRAVNFVGAGKWNRAEMPLDLGYFQRKFLKHPTWKAPLWGISLCGNNDFTASLTGTIDNCFFILPVTRCCSCWTQSIWSKLTQLNLLKVCFGRHIFRLAPGAASAAVGPLTGSSGSMGDKIPFYFI